MLPQANPNTSRVHAYLRSRGIDSDLIDFCIQTGRLYESTPHHNAVFVGLDKYNKPRYANLRGLGTDFVGVYHSVLRFDKDETKTAMRRITKGETN